MAGMAETVSYKRLHLEYRIWIAELNHDINLIRILNDHIIEMADENKTTGAGSVAEVFGNKFNELRQTIDQLRHRMHIEKMNLAATAREQSTIDSKIDFMENYTAIREDFFAFRVVFNEVKGKFDNLKI